MNISLLSTPLERFTNYKGLIELCYETLANNMNVVYNVIQEFDSSETKFLKGNASTLFFLVANHYQLRHNNNAARESALLANILRIIEAENTISLQKQPLLSIQSDLSWLRSNYSDLKTKRKRIERQLDKTRCKIMQGYLSMNSNKMKRLKREEKKQVSVLKTCSLLLYTIQTLIEKKKSAIAEKMANEAEVIKLANGRHIVLCNHSCYFTGTRNECYRYCQDNGKRMLLRNC